MFRLGVKIKINEYVFSGAITTEIIKSLDNMTDTAVIVLPNVIYTNKKTNVAQSSSTITALIKRGDPVWIWSDYDKTADDLTLKFRGFVSRLNAKNEITVHCEDYMHVLKNINVPSKKMTNVSLSTFIKYILQDSRIKYDLIDPAIDLGVVQIDNKSVLNAVQCLEELKSNYGLISYFEDDTLMVGRLLDVSRSEHSFIFEHNIVEDSLDYRSDADVNLVIKGVSILDNNTKIERYAYLKSGVKTVSVASIPGEQITLTYYNKTETQLKELITNNFEKYIYSGFSGNFTTLLRPVVLPGDVAKLYSLAYPERNGKYKVKSVKQTTGMDGGYQVIELDYKISDL